MEQEKINRPEDRKNVRTDQPLERLTPAEIEALRREGKAAMRELLGPEHAHRLRD